MFTANVVTPLNKRGR